jgi:hypothetical protein
MNSQQMKKIGIFEAYMPIDGYKNYEVSNFGNVKNKSTGRVLKPGINRDGYYIVSLCDGQNKKTKTIHRLVAEAFLNNHDNKPCVDHIDNNKLNNCDFNLRYATHQDNSRNISMLSKNTSGVKGVCWHKHAKKWHARIKIDGKLIHLGCFDNIDDAKLARQKKAKELFGEYTNKCEM